jgi:hypothetical protein
MLPGNRLWLYIPNWKVKTAAVFCNAVNVRTIAHLVKHNALRRTVPEPVLARLKPYQAHVYAAKDWNAAEYASGRRDFLEQVRENQLITASWWVTVHSLKATALSWM